MTDQFEFGSRTITYGLCFSDRKTLGITVHPDDGVLVKAPFDASREKIQEKLRKKAPWIIKQQSYFLSFQPRTPARKFLSGETHLYLGRQYRLKILIRKENYVGIKGGYIEVHCQSKNEAKTLMQEWYLSKAKQKFEIIAKPLIERFRRQGVSPTDIVLRNMSMRWGSCTPKGKIILNPELIKAPKACIEYVIIHELCHLVHLDHTKSFIELQTREMKDWEKWKEKLERLLA